MKIIEIAYSGFVSIIPVIEYPPLAENKVDLIILGCNLGSVALASPKIGTTKVVLPKLYKNLYSKLYSYSFPYISL